MKTRVIILFALIAGPIFTGCATTSNEPEPHVEQCHVKDGMLLDRKDCISDHNQIVLENKAKARERSLRSIDRSGRR
jgi:hypothetical protein